MKARTAAKAWASRTPTGAVLTRTAGSRTGRHVLAGAAVLLTAGAVYAWHAVTGWLAGVGEKLAAPFTGGLLLKVGIGALLLGMLGPSAVPMLGAPWYRLLPSACGGAPDTPEGGIVGVAGRTGELLHGMTREPPDADRIAASLTRWAFTAGRTVGTLTATARGAARPTAPALPPAQQITACCSPADPGVLAAGQRTGDTPAMTAARAARTAGWAGPDLTVAVAIAGAESGWDPTAANPTSTARGLWQIMLSYHAPKLAGADWRDPTVNARVAHTIWRQAAGWTPWEVWTTGAYRAYLDRAAQAVALTAGAYGPPVELDVPAVPAAVQPAACIGTSSPPPGRPGAPQVEAALAYALAQVGKPYAWGALPQVPGGPVPGAFDCSSLVDSAYLAAGIDLPGRATTATLIRMGTGVPVDAVARGDLVFTGPGHVGIALGDGTMIAAPRTGVPVRVSPHGTPWQVRRIVDPTTRPT